MGEPGGDSATESEILRAFLRGDLATLDAADAADLTASAFLDLVERVREADATFGAGGGRDGDIPDISVVVPMFNEEGNLRSLIERLVPVLDSIGTYEIVFVDDLSTDGSREVVLQARAANPAIKLIELARNFGHQGALAAGLAHAAGRAVVLMDADLQDPPEVLPGLVQRWRDGFEVVYAIREKRKEGPILRACFYVFYRLVQRISEIDLPVDAGDFCLMDRKVVDALLALPESNRYLRGLRGWVGFRQVGVPYERGARLTGETKYSVRDRVRFAVDGLLSFSDIPLRLASLGGLLTTFAGLLYLLWAIISRLFGGEVAAGWTSIIFIQLIVGGIQLIMIGVSGEYLARTYQETKRRPSFVLRATHGTSLVNEARR